MKNKNILENLELKLAQTKKENKEKLDKIESEFKKRYSDFFDIVLKNDNLGFKRYISVNFQLEKLDNSEKSNFEIFKNSISKTIEILPLNNNKKEKLEKKLIKLAENKNNLAEIFRKNNDLRRDINFPILQDLQKHGILNENDILNITLRFKETHNFLDSISILKEDKKEIIKHDYYELHNAKTEKKLENFQHDFAPEIKKSKLLKIYPRVLKFIAKNYFRLRLKNKVESKRERLRRLYKIAFLRLYRLKYSGIDIEKILQKIDTLDDFDDFISLIIKYFEVLKQNPSLQKDYIVSEELDEVNDSLDEAEDNKEKILSLEQNVIEVNKILENFDGKINQKDLEELLSDNFDLVGNEFINRKILEKNILEENKKAGIYTEDNINLEESDEENEEEKDEEIIDTEEYYKNLQEEYLKLEEKKKKIFLFGEYDKLDEINKELLDLSKKMEKLKKII